jgi:hypothetical protein
MGYQRLLGFPLNSDEMKTSLKLFRFYVGGKKRKGHESAWGKEAQGQEAKGAAAKSTGVAEAPRIPQ